MVSFERYDQESLKHRLSERRATLLTEIREVTGRTEDEPFRALTGGVGDSGDEATASTLLDTDRAAIDRDLAEVRAIDAALERIDRGEYGLCIDCTEHIGAERLSAQPTALRCMRCQERHEHAYAARSVPPRL